MPVICYIASEMRYLVLPLVSSLFLACVHATPIQAPGGGQGYKISCSGTDSCMAKARELCPDGYHVDTNTPQFGAYSTSSITSPVYSTGNDWVVSCDNGEPQQSTTVTNPDASVCNAASKKELMQPFATNWAARRNGRPLNELPDKKAFLRMCKGMEEDVQQCLHETYRASHSKRCDALLLRLAPHLITRIDALFLEHSPEEISSEASAKDL